MAQGDNRTVTAREHEAFLDLFMHLAEILATDWEKEHPVAVEEVKRQISGAMRRALEIWI